MTEDWDYLYYELCNKATERTRYDLDLWRDYSSYDKLSAIARQIHEDIALLAPSPALTGSSLVTIDNPVSG